MLTYLDSLCDAMATRDLPRLRHLIEGHPLVRLLPADALAEARRFLAQKAGRHAVPLAMLRFRDQTARLLNERPLPGSASLPAAAPTPTPPSAPSASRSRRTAVQTELALSA